MYGGTPFLVVIKFTGLHSNITATICKKYISTITFGFQCRNLIDSEFSLRSLRCK